MDRQASISIALGGAEFNLEKFETVERLSEPFEIVVDGFCAEEIDFLDHLGKPASLDAGSNLDHARYFHGLITEAELRAHDINGSHYRLTLRPWFALLDQNRDYRIFQDKSVVEIAKQVFSDLNMKDVSFDKLTGSYRKREYCVQYKESDFNFLSRIFEDEGIYYYFDHSKTAHKMILCDGKSAHAAASGYDEVRFHQVLPGAGFTPDTLGEWSERVTSAALTKVSLRSFDFTKPQNPVDGSAEAGSQHPQDALEVYEYLGDFVEPGVGNARSKTRLAASRAARRIYRGKGDAPGLACGGLFTLTRADPDRYNQEYLITALRHVWVAEAHRSGVTTSAPEGVSVEAIPGDTVFRPPLRTPRPSADGPETATVAGPSGEVIYVDEHGRVKVRFHWDRARDDPGKNSCWMRVSHHSASDTYGHVSLPRVGQEVIVDFLDGDPDRPIITGRVYNGQRTHKYALPTDKTKSVWRTETVGDAGSYSGAEKQPPSGKGFNEIRIEDKGGSEEVYIHAQREMVTDVLLDQKLTVQRDRIDRFGRDRTVAVKRNEKLTVEDGDETHTVSTGKRTTKIQQNDELTVEQGDQKMTVSMGNVAHQVKMGNYTLKVDLGKIEIEAMQSITLTVGSSSIKIDQMGVTIKGMMIKTDAQVQHQTKAPMVQIQGDAMTMVKGGIVMIN